MIGIEPQAFVGRQHRGVDEARVDRAQGERLELEELAELGIAVHLIRGYGDTAVAEATIALMWAAALVLGADPAGSQAWSRQNQMLNGLSVGAGIEANGNWEADTDKWNAPLLFNVSKVTRLGKRPVSFQLAAGPYIASPDAGASWRFRLSANFLFPR